MQINCGFKADPSEVAYGRTVRERLYRAALRANFDAMAEVVESVVATVDRTRIHELWLHVSGKVVLLVTIQADGKVSATKVESGHALLAPAAQDAVSRWRFAPGPEASESEVDVNFSSDGQ